MTSASRHHERQLSGGELQSPPAKVTSGTEVFDFESQTDSLQVLDTTGCTGKGF